MCLGATCLNFSTPWKNNPEKGVCCCLKGGIKSHYTLRLTGILQERVFMQSSYTSLKKCLRKITWQFITHTGNCSRKGHLGLNVVEVEQTVRTDMTPQSYRIDLQVCTSAQPLLVKRRTATQLLHEIMLEIRWGPKNEPGAFLEAF
eukprot:1161383-Pelagomonas_calceolata.AAC.14